MGRGVGVPGVAESWVMEFPEDLDHQIYDVEMACTFLRRKKDWLLDACQARRIGHIKDGRKIMFFRYHLVDYLKRREVPVEDRPGSRAA